MQQVDVLTGDSSRILTSCTDISGNSFDWDDNIYYNDTFLPQITKFDEMNAWEVIGNCISPRLSSATCNKPLLFSVQQSNCTVNTDWKQKAIQDWSVNDIMYWIISVIKDNALDIDDVDISRFNDLDGTTLCNLTETQFVTRSPIYGKFLFTNLRQLLDQKNSSHLFPAWSSDKVEEPDGESRVIADISLINTVSESQKSSEESKTPNEVLPKKRPPGRPRLNSNGPGRRGKKPPEKKTGRLWEFIKNLLLNPEYCPSLICWENHDEGVFRFVRSEKVANLWGTIKENPKMTYEKLSRAMRYYYKSKVLQPVLGRRLVYKFGPTASGWRTSNPNFKLPAVKSHL